MAILDYFRHLFAICYYFGLIYPKMSKSLNNKLPVERLETLGGPWRTLGGPWRTLEDLGEPWRTLEDLPCTCNGGLIGGCGNQYHSFWTISDDFGRFRTYISQNVKKPDLFLAVFASWEACRFLTNCQTMVVSGGVRYDIASPYCGSEHN